jgi:hypothetical protein
LTLVRARRAAAALSSWPFAAAVLLVTAVLVATARPYEEEEYLATGESDGAVAGDRAPVPHDGGGYGVGQLSR